MLLSSASSVLRSAALARSFATASGETLPIVVCGAHLSGMPLNPQLTNLGGSLKVALRTAPRYKLYDVSRSEKEVSRPGLIQVSEGAPGSAYDVEIWNLPAENYGRFMEFVKAPLAIGNVLLEDGSVVKGFVCEGYAIEQAKDISHFSGWRAYMASRVQK